VHSLPARKFEWTYEQLRTELLTAPCVEMGEWQAQRMSMRTYEIENVGFTIGIPPALSTLQAEISPNLPWAEDHFQERVSGWPLNPPPSEAWWPHAVKGNSEHKSGELFSHTYPERFWPKWAGDHGGTGEPPNRGIRFKYGDLGDLVEQLRKSPTTRQAYLPVWFPEDTGAVHGERVPCTLGYHFLLRKDHLNITYFIRSCDLIRHFRDDVYMACRLCQWVAHRIGKSPGTLTMHIVSLHIFEPDRIRMGGLL
jgi:hypothetical protein